MTDRSFTVRIALVTCGLTLALIVGAVVLASLNRRLDWDLSFLVSTASAALVGCLIVTRQPANPVGWFISGHALCFTLGEFSRQYAIYGLLTAPGALPFARAMASPPYWIWYPGLTLLLAFLPLYFPNGRLVSRRWQPLLCSPSSLPRSRQVLLLSCRAMRKPQVSPTRWGSRA